MEIFLVFFVLVSSLLTSALEFTGTPLIDEFDLTDNGANPTSLTVSYWFKRKNKEVTTYSAQIAKHIEIGSFSIGLKHEVNNPAEFSSDGTGLSKISFGSPTERMLGDPFFDWLWTYVLVIWNTNSSIQVYQGFDDPMISSFEYSYLSPAFTTAGTTKTLKIGDVLRLIHVFVYTELT